MEDTILEALFLLFQAYGVYVIYELAKRLAAATTVSRIKSYVTALGVSAFIAAILWAYYGTHIENTDDPLYGKGDIVQDFVPTDQERNKHGVFVFIVIGITSLVGTHKGLKIKEMGSTLN